MQARLCHLGSYRGYVGNTVRRRNRTSLFSLPTPAPPSLRPSLPHSVASVSSHNNYENRHPRPHRLLRQPHRHRTAQSRPSRRRLLSPSGETRKTPKLLSRLASHRNNAHLRPHHRLLRSRHPDKRLQSGQWTERLQYPPQTSFSLPSATNG